MAIINESGNYLKLTNTTIAYNNEEYTITIRGDLYPDASTRWDGLGAFQTTVPVVVSMTDFNFTYNDPAPIKDKILTNAYLTLKTVEPYSSWTDDV